MRLPLAMTLSAAIHKAEPPITVEREPLVPMPKATRSVSPSMYWTVAGIEPELFVEHLLEGGLVALALVLAAHQQGRVAARVKADLGEFLAGPGRLLDRVGDADAAQLAARLAPRRGAPAKPAQSACASAFCWLAGKSPQS